MTQAAPLDELKKMGMTWPSEASPAFITSIGLIETAGGLGLWLTALTRIMLLLTVLAALCCTVLQALAGALFILWGRSKRAPIEPR